jgi:pyruvate/2-oxoglutarate dehydrogenase complex dihydrolipoamide dehydrogenase (E3) component
MKTENFDAIIIGAGQAGPPLAGRLSSSGMKVAVVERKLFGGTCVNTGCTPTKTMIASAYAAHLARRARLYGVETGPVTVNMQAVKARKDAIVRASRHSVEQWLRGMSNCTTVHGHAKMIGPDAVEVNGRRLVAPRIFLNVGSRAATPNLPGLREVPALTSSTLLDLELVPRHLVVIGGSYIGLEFAQAFRRFGAAVTVVEKADRLIAREDYDISTAIEDIFEKEGIVIRTAAECIRLEGDRSGIAVGVDCRSRAEKILASHVLLATGRRPNTDDLGLETAGVHVDDGGFIVVDEELSTNVKGIWALGDCNGRGAFTHTAYNDYEIVATNLLDGGSRKVGHRIPSYGLFIDPPLGRVGMTEREAAAAGLRVRIGKRPMTRVGRAREKGETLGFMKVIVDAESDRILGAAVLGVSGDEAVHSVLGAMNAGLTASDFTRTVPIHPTVSELIPTIVQELQP